MPSPPPVVTGVSPKEGPPGTRVTVRGEYLGVGPSDLIGLTICGCDCHLSAEWKSPNKIIARAGPGKGRGDIIVTTRLGGTGTSTVQFKVYHETIGPLKESAVWVDEAPLQTLVWGRRSLSPGGFQQEDPLGLSVEGNDKKFPEDDLHDLFPDGSGDLTSDQFVAARFLLEHHHATSFGDLKAGLNFLKRKVDSQKEGQLSFLKSNVGSVMDQLDTLIVLKEKFELDLIDYGPDPTSKLEKAIEESMIEANKLFEEVLARRDRADATRNALGVLQRFKFLFCLPVNIERNIRKGDYDVVINDYTRAKNLFGKTDIVIFKKVLMEVEQRINMLREILYNKLQEMPSSIEDQKKIIRNLVNLECNGDPAWDCISCHSKFIAQQLNACKDEHLAVEGGSNKSKSSSHSPSVSSKYKMNNNFSQNQDNASSVPQRVIFVEDLTEAITDCFPNLWKLGQAYFSGELHVRVDSSKQDQFKRMVLNSIEHFCNLLRAALLPHTLDRLSPQRQSFGIWPTQGMELIWPWLPHCLRYVRTTYSTFIRLDLPGEALDILAKLIFDLRLHAMSTLFQQTSEQIKSFHKKEVWKIEFDNKHGGITDLPFQFESKVHEVLQQVKESVLMGEHRESPLLESAQAQKELEGQMQNLLLSFVNALKSLAFDSEGKEHDHLPSVSQLIGSPEVYRRGKESSGPIWEQRLLTTLSNCQYSEQIVIPRIVELFSRLGYPPLKGPVETAKNAFLDLDKQIMELYLEQKSDPLVGTIEPSMYLGQFDWDTHRKPTDVRPYAKEILANITGVLAEVQHVSPHLAPKVIQQIVETVAEELARLMSCVTRFSKEGNQQARADIQALQNALKIYITPVAESFFEEALEAIPPLTDPEDNKVIEEILKQFQDRLRLQLICFTDFKTQPSSNTKVI